MGKNEISIQRQAVIEEIKSTITLDNKSISSYGATVGSKLTEFSTEILKSVKVKDSPEVEDLILQLVGQLNSIDCNALQPKKKGLLAKLFGGEDPKNFIAKYESVHAFITGVATKLSQAEYTLGKDIEVCESYLKTNKEYIGELDLYIEAGNQFLEQAKAEYLDRKSRINEDTDVLEAQELQVLENDIDTFERKIHALEIQRMVAIQNIPQLLLVKQGDAVLVEKIKSSIDTSIPLWESQMVIAIQTMRQQQGAKLVKAVTDTNNELLRRNAQLLKQSTTAVAKELERDIVDLDTLKNTNDMLISTFSEIRQIREDGAKKRAAVAVELQNLQAKMIESTVNSKVITDKREGGQAVASLPNDELYIRRLSENDR